MIYIITLILSVLVGINFLLLKFSCNKTVKIQKIKEPRLINPSTQKTITTQHASGQLAATGS